MPQSNEPTDMFLYCGFSSKATILSENNLGIESRIKINLHSYIFFYLTVLFLKVKAQD